MKKFVRGRLGRALSMVLMVAMLLPGLLSAFAGRANAAAGWGRKVFLLPLTSSAPNAPANIGNDVLRELQLAMLKQEGTEVYELNRTSPLLELAMNSGDLVVDQQTRSDLMYNKVRTEFDKHMAKYPASDQHAMNKALIQACYDVATDPGALVERRNAAVAYLGRVLGADAVIYSTVDNYEVVDKPLYVMVNITATEITSDTKGQPVARSFFGRGKSTPRPGGGVLDAHVNEAVVNVARNVADQLAGIAPQPDTHQDQPKVKKKRGGLGLWAATLVTIGSVIALSRTGGSKSSTFTTPGEGYAFAMADGVRLRLGIPAAKSQTAEKYEVTRKVTNRGRATEPPFTVLPAQTQVIGDSVYIVDRTAVAGFRYTYRVKAYLRNAQGKPEAIDMVVYSGDAPQAERKAEQSVAPGVPTMPQRIASTNPVGSQVHLTWTYDADATTSLIRSILIQYRPVGGTAMKELTLPGTAQQATLTLEATDRDVEVFIYTLGDNNFKFGGSVAPFVIHVTPRTLGVAQNLTATAVRNNDGKTKSIILSWQEPQDSYVKGYRVYRVSQDSRSRSSNLTDIFGLRGKTPVRVNGSRSSFAATLGRVPGGRTSASSYKDLPVGSTSLRDDEVQDGIVYSYYIQSLSDVVSGEYYSDPSNEVLIDLPPAGVSSFAGMAGDSAAALRWTAPTKNADGSPISLMNRGGFLLFRMSTAPTSQTGYTENELAGRSSVLVPWVDGKSQYDWTDNTAANRNTYYYAVGVVDNAGQWSIGPYPFVRLTPMPPASKFSIDSAIKTVTAGAAPITLQVQVADDKGLGLGGYTVAFQVPAGLGSFSSQTVTTDATGKATVQYLAPTYVDKSTPVTVTAIVAEVQGLGGILPLTIVPAVPSNLEVAVVGAQPVAAITSAQQQNPPARSQTDLTIRLTDPQGVTIPGKPVRLDCSDKDAAYLDPSTGDYVSFGQGTFQGTTDLAGTVHVHVRAGMQVGTMTFTALSGSLTTLASVQVVAGDPATMTIDIPSSVNARTKGTLTVKDGNGNPVAEAQVVMGANLGKVVQAVVYTDANGQASFDFDPDGKVGMARITASIAGAVTATADVQCTKLTNPQLLQGTLTVGMSSTTNYSFKLFDSKGDAMKLTPVKVKVTAGTLQYGMSAGPEVTISTNTDGEAVFTYGAPASQGAVTLSFATALNAAIGDNVTLKVISAAPTGLTATSMSDKQIDLTWIGITGNNGYELQRSTDEVNWTTVKTLAKDAVLPYSDTTLLSGTQYYYRVRTLGTVADYNSDWSATASAQTWIGAPTNVHTTQITDTTVSLSWMAVAGATRYEVESSADGINAWTTMGMVPDPELAYDATGLTPSTAVYLRVVAVDKNDKRNASTSLKVTTAPSAPTGVTATAVSAAQVTVSWTGGTGVTSYTIERSLDRVVWSGVGTVSGTESSFDDDSVQGGTTYFYRVIAKTGTVESPASVLKSVTTWPAAVMGLMIEQGTSVTSVKLSWLPSTGSESYTIETSNDGINGWTAVGAVPASATQFPLSGLAVGTAIYVRVSAVNAAGATATKPLRVLTSLQPPSGLTLVMSGTNQVTLSWNAVTGVTGYDIQRKTDTSDWQPVGTVNELTTSLTDSGLLPGTTYYYSVRAKNWDGESAWSQPASLITSPAAPLNFHVVSVSDTTVELAWGESCGTTQYRVQSSADGLGNWTDEALVPADTLTYTISGMTPNTMRYFRVAAENASGNTPSNGIKVTTFPVASALGLKATAQPNGTVDLTWSAVSGAVLYEVQRSTDKIDWTAIGSTKGATSLVDTGLSNGSTYYYQVRVTTAAGQSGWSPITPEATVETLPGVPQDLAVVGASDTSITLQWTPSGASSYVVETSMDGVANWTVVTEVPTNTATITGLTPNATVYYRVAGKNTVGTGAFSAPVQAMTDATPPLALTFSAADARIYYSTRTEDQLSQMVPKATNITFTGYTDSTKATLAADTLVTVKITAGNGVFKKTRNEQIESPDGKSITGLLDANGEMIVSYMGRTDTFGMPGVFTQPTANELTPATFMLQLTNKLTGISRMVPMEGTTPKLVGPPYSVTISPSPYYEVVPSKADPNPIKDVTAQAFDIARQPVLADMPIWFAQQWTPYDPANPVPNNAAGAATLRSLTNVTDNQGKCVAQFSSGHSGLYTVQAYALRPGANLPLLNSIDNMDLANPDGTVAAPYLLRVSENGGPITAGTRILNKTLAGNDAQWTVSASLVSIPVDGVITSRIMITATDVDNKTVMEGVPFSVEATRAQLKATETGAAYRYGEPLELTFDKDGKAYAYLRPDQPRTAGEGIVPRVGYANIILNNYRLTGMYTEKHDVVAIEGPALNPASAGYEPVQLHVDGLISLRDTPPTGRGIDPPKDNSDINVWLFYKDEPTRPGNQFPIGYTFVLKDDGTDTYWPADLTVSTATDCSAYPVSFNYRSWNELGTHRMRLQIFDNINPLPIRDIPFTITVSLPAPTNLKVADPVGNNPAITTSAAHLQWDASSRFVSGYYIYNLTNSYAPSTTVYGANTTNGWVTGLNAGTKYRFAVGAFHSSGIGSMTPSPEVIEVLTLPGALTGVSYVFEPKGRKPEFSWARPYGQVINGYKIVREGAGGTETTTITDVNKTTFTDNTASNGEKYKYTVLAYNDTGDGEFTGNVFDVIVPPGQVTVSANNVSGTQITLDWTKPGGAELSGYIIERYLNGVLDNTVFVQDPNKLTYDDKDLPAGTKYSYILYAYNDKDATGHRSLPSATLDVTTLPPTVLNLQSDAAKLTATSVTLTWDLVSIAVDGYRIFRDGQQVGEVKDPTVNTYTDSTGLKANTAYKYTVSAFIGTTNSAASNEVSVTTAK